MLLVVLFQSSRVFSSLHVSGERKYILCIKDKTDLLILSLQSNWDFVLKKQGFENKILACSSKWPHALPLTQHFALNKKLTLRLTSLT